MIIKNQRSCTVAKFNLNSKTLAVVWGNQQIILYLPLLYIYLCVSTYVHDITWPYKVTYTSLSQVGKIRRAAWADWSWVSYWDPLPTRQKNMPWTLCAPETDPLTLAMPLANKSEQVSPLNIFWACMVVFHCQQNHLIVSTTFSWKVMTWKWMVHWFYSVAGTGYLNALLFDHLQ